MSYRDEQEEKAVELRDELFQDPGGGIWDGEPEDFVLENPKLNLWDKIQDEAMAYFNEYDIKWHRGEPEGHLLSSNIACVNHLFFLRQHPDLASAVLKNIDSRIVSADIIERGHVAFEINGKENYLGEKGHTRGVLSTCVDAVMIGKKNDGKNILVLIEWKYTEDYSKYSQQKKVFQKLENRRAIYSKLLQDKNCPIKNICDFDALCYEPFYQLMRQTLLGWKMVKAEEYGCDEYIHLHIIPKGNVELRRNITSPSLKPMGKDMSDVWKNLLKDPDKYRVISPDDFLSPLTGEKKAEEFLKYLKTRYWQ
jgi:hypothetical protein